MCRNKLEAERKWHQISCGIVVGGKGFDNKRNDRCSILLFRLLNLMAQTGHNSRIDLGQT